MNCTLYVNSSSDYFGNTLRGFLKRFLLAKLLFFFLTHSPKQTQDREEEKRGLRLATPMVISSEIATFVFSGIALEKPFRDSLRNSSFTPLRILTTIIPITQTLY